MASENVGLSQSATPQETPEIQARQLAQILAEMDENIKGADEAAKAEVAAKGAKDAAEAAIRASQEAGEMGLGEGYKTGYRGTSWFRIKRYLKGKQEKT